MSWPLRGVYFFFEDGERWTDSGTGPRIVRVGTHALILKSRTTLWNRLSQHRGVRATGGGNHRGSILRSHVGTALSATRQALKRRSWAQDSPASAVVRRKEHALKLAVSETIGKMPFVWVAIDDAAGPESVRGYIERNAIALLSSSGSLLLTYLRRLGLDNTAWHESGNLASGTLITWMRLADGRFLR